MQLFDKLLPKIGSKGTESGHISDQAATVMQPSPNPGIKSNGPRNDRRYDISIILSDGFLLATFTIGIMAWIIDFCGACAASAQDVFPHLGWWVIVYQLMVIVGLTFAVITSSVHNYHQLICVGLGISCVYLTLLIDNSVYSGLSSMGAVAAGSILLAIVQFAWLFYFGTRQEAPIHTFVNRFSVYGGNRPLGNFSHDGNALSQMETANTATNINAVNHPSPMIGTNNRSSVLYPHMHSSARLSTTNNNNTVNEGGDVDDDVIPMPTEYPYRAHAIYDYQANPEDSNEISFNKGDVLQVSDISGRWWQARNVIGQVGICPSNYVQLITSEDENNE